MKKLWFIILLSLVFISCGKKNTTESPNELADLGNYVGTWEAKCTSAYPTKHYIMYITDTGGYYSLEKTYLSADDCGNEAKLSDIMSYASTLTAIKANDKNSEYQDVNYDHFWVKYAAFDSTTITSRNTEKKCSADDWQSGVYKTFDADNTGPEPNNPSYPCFATNGTYAAKISGDTLTINGRAGFDGNDPDYVVYTKTSTTTGLEGKIGGKLWFSASASAKLIGTSTDYTVYIYDEYYDTPCTSGLASTTNKSLILTMPWKVGTVDISTNIQNFYDGTTNNVATTGTLTVDNVTDTEITISYDGKYDDNNYAKGSLKVTKCSE